jgi:hypothetical protein
MQEHSCLRILGRLLARVRLLLRRLTAFRSFIGGRNRRFFAGQDDNGIEVAAILLHRGIHFVRLDGLTLDPGFQFSVLIEHFLQIDIYVRVDYGRCWQG